MVRTTAARCAAYLHDSFKRRNVDTTSFLIWLSKQQKANFEARRSQLNCWESLGKDWINCDNIGGLRIMSSIFSANKWGELFASILGAQFVIFGSSLLH